MDASLNPKNAELYGRPYNSKLEGFADISVIQKEIDGLGHLSAFPIEESNQ